MARYEVDFGNANIGVRYDNDLLPDAKAVTQRAKAEFPPAHSGYEAWSKGYQDAQKGLKQSPYESGSDLDSWYNTGFDDARGAAPYDEEYGQRAE